MQRPSRCSYHYFSIHHPAHHAKQMSITPPPLLTDASREPDTVAGIQWAHNKYLCIWGMQQMYKKYLWDELHWFLNSPTPRIAGFTLRFGLPSVSAVWKQTLVLTYPQKVSNSLAPTTIPTPSTSLRLFTDNFIVSRHHRKKGESRMFRYFETKKKIIHVTFIVSYYYHHSNYY